MPEMMIQTENLTKRFPCSSASQERDCAPLESEAIGGESLTWFTAVDRLTLNVAAGEILAAPVGMAGVQSGSRLPVSLRNEPVTAVICPVPTRR